MSQNDDDDDASSPGSEIDLDFEWGDALDEWEGEVESSAEARSTPMPQTVNERPAAPARALYRPPSPDEQFARRAPAVRPPAPGRPPVKKDDFAGLDDDGDDAIESTRIARIPQELIESLIAKEERGNEHPTRPPPAAKAGGAPVAPPAIDLDLDGLLGGMETETRNAAQPYKPAAKPRPPIGGAVEEDDGIVASFPPSGSTALLDDDSDGDEHAQKTRMAPVPRPPGLPSAVTARGPSALEPRGPVPPPRPPVPPPGARPAVPRPGLPPIPRPGQVSGPKPAIPRPGVPKPGGAPAVPRPPLPSIPRPLAKPAVPAPVSKPAVPEPAVAESSEPAPARHESAPPEPVRPESVRPEPMRPEPVRPEPSRSEPPREPAPEEERARAVEAVAEELGLDAPLAKEDQDLDALFGLDEPTGEPAAMRSAPVAPGADRWDEGWEDEEPAGEAPNAERDRDDEPPPADDAPESAEIDLDASSAEIDLDASSAELGEDDEARQSIELSLDGDRESLEPSQEPISTGAALDEVLGVDAEDDASDRAGTDEAEVDEADEAEVDEADEAATAELETAELETAEDEAAEDEAAEDEAEAEIEAGEDGDADFELGDDEDGDDLVVEAGEGEGEADEDEDWEALEAAEDQARAEDRGAQAARRSVRSRKPRDETFPMVGDGPEALRLRRRLLESLASTREGALRARLLVGAAELAEQLGEPDAARALYQRAIESDPGDVVAIRALRRDATARGAWDELAALFEKEAALALAPAERALALTGLAEVHLGRRGDRESAERAAAQAIELAPGSLSARMLLAEARFAQGRTDDALEALGQADESWDDPRGQASLLVARARHAEHQGQLGPARDHYRAAAALDEGDLEALFGLARTSTGASGDGAAAVSALKAIAASLSGPLAEAVRTRASRVATLLSGDAREGVALLEGATSVPALQARADAAAATGDRDVALSCLGAWASAAGGTDRALALVRMAEALAAGDDLDGAEAALRDAALADGSLGTIRVVREVIARRTGDMSRLVQALEAGGALSAAARVASGADALEREHDLLATAASEGNALVAVDVLTLDVAAARGDGGSLDAALRRQADRVPPERRVGSLLALAERSIERGDLEGAEAALSEARGLAPGDPLVLRPLGRLALRRDATATAALWMEESSVGTGERAAYAATEAGRVLARVEGDAVGALRRALDASRGYAPAAALLKPLATELGDPLTLLEAHEQLASTATSPTDAAGHLVRAALLRAQDDPDGAGALLERARQAAPEDAVLISLLMRLSGAGTPAERGAMLAARAASAPPILARVFRLQAAASFEDAEEPARAASQYRLVAEADPDDPVVGLGLDRAEIAAGEIARVSERRFRAVKEADTDDRRVLALERLADLDLHERQDPGSAVLSLQSILEVAPGHLPSLRALQRYFAEHARREDEVEVLDRMAGHLEEGPDVTAHLRLARRLLLAPAEAPGEAADDLLIRHAPRAELDLWLAPRVLAAAEAQHSQPIAETSARRTAELLASASERATARVRAAEIVRATDPEASLELLRDAVQSAPLHPFASSMLAETYERDERWEDAAEAWEEAAKASEVRTRAASLAYRAGRLWEDRVKDVTRARAAYEQAAERDVTYGDLFDRLRGLLEAASAHDRLATLYTQRLAAGGEAPALVELYVKQAGLYTTLSELGHAKSALRAALALQPERLDALRALANLCIEDEDWRGAAEVLIRIARIRKEREELRWVFFTLGDIYDRHMPDPRRAEAAFQRVLKLLPEDVPAMERLAALFEREGSHAKAAEILVELARVDVDPEQSRSHRLKLAEMHERLGDARRAEQVLEEARKNAPTDPAVLRALRDFYQRQGAGNALQMHLSRAVNDFRHALDADLGDAAAWPGLVEVLSWRGDGDAASAAASAAQALGIVDVETSKLVDARGAAPGLLGGAVLESLDELLAPAHLPAAAREVFKLAGDALEKALPFDVAAYRAEKLNPRDTMIRPIALEVARAFGIPEPQLYVTSAAPRVCVPVYSNPVSVLIGSELLGITDDREKLFVLVRAFKIAHAQLSVVVRAQPAELLALVGGLVSIYDPRHVAPGADPAHVAEAGRRIAKTLQKKAQGELGPLVFEMAGRPGYDPSRFAMAASEWGNRTALVASGSTPAAIAALAKLSGERELPPDPTARLAMLQRFPEAASLLAFAISDAHFEARKRAS